MRIWNQVKELASQTPPNRNRYIDFLRAASILVVIIGHWLITTVYYDDGSLTSEHLFAIQPLTRWLTWFFQVMPIFLLSAVIPMQLRLKALIARDRVTRIGWQSDCAVC